MEQSVFIDQVEQAKALFKPVRLEIIKQLDQPRTCGQLAEVFGQSPQKIYYHIKILENAGLVNKVDEKRVRGIMEGYYQAAGHSYWLAPEMVQKLGGEKQTKQDISLGYLLQLAEQLHVDTASLMQKEGEVPSLGLSAHIELRSEDERAAFMAELQDTIQNLAEKYGARQTDAKQNSQTFKLVTACYPSE